MTQDHFEDMTNLEDFFHTSRLPLVSVIKPRLTKKSTANVTKHENKSRLLLSTQNTNANEVGGRFEQGPNPFRDLFGNTFPKVEVLSFAPPKFPLKTTSTKKHEKNTKKPQPLTAV